MRQAIEQPKKAGGPLGIRPGVWFIAFGLVLLCVLSIELSCLLTALSKRGIAPEDISNLASARPPAGVRRTSHIKFTPAYYEGDRNDDSALMSVVEQMTQDRRTWMDNTARNLQ